MGRVGGDQGPDRGHLAEDPQHTTRNSDNTTEQTGGVDPTTFIICIQLSRLGEEKRFIMF